MSTSTVLSDVVAAAGGGLQVFTDAAKQPTTEAKVATAVQEGAQVAAAFVPKSIAPVIAAGAALEPEIYHLISALIHLFSSRKP
ncbi:MAG: hypothetical protein JO041_15625 [Acidobacteria bacterium]|nr:hypothetical protein [Acidobacteriota bacterium]